MSMPASIPSTVQIKRTRLVGLVVAVAIFAAAVTAAVFLLAVGSGSHSARVSVPAVVAPSSVSPLTRAEAQSIGAYLFGSEDSPTPAQRQAIRNYWMGASMPIGASDVRSIGVYLFGTSGPLSRAQLKTVRNYWVAAASGAR